MSAPIYLSKRESVIEPIYLGYIFPFTQRLHVNSCSVSLIARLQDFTNIFWKFGVMHLTQISAWKRLSIRQDSNHCLTRQNFTKQTVFHWASRPRLEVKFVKKYIYFFLSWKKSEYSCSGWGNLLQKWFYFEQKLNRKMNKAYLQTSSGLAKEMKWVFGNNDKKSSPGRMGG